MKIRQGFVSNSSSSSFIVAFPKDMQITSNSVQGYLFEGQDSITAYDWVGTFDVKKIADQVTQDMCEQEPNNEKRIIDALSGHISGAPDFDKFRTRNPNKPNDWEYDWDGYQKASDAFREQMVKKLKKEFEGMDIFTFEYGDGDGNFFCTMEHGGIFNNVPHMVISNH